MFICQNYMKKYGFRAWPLYEMGGGGVFKRFSHFSDREKIQCIC